MKIDKQINYSHGLTQTKQKVGPYIGGTLLVHERTTGKHKLIRLIRPKLEGSHHLPLILFYVSSHEANTQMSFCLESLEISKIGTSMTLEAHNFACKPPIGVMSTEKL
jgi:hypothetical protein